MVRFTIPLRPVPKGRPRFNGHAYTPSKTRDYEASVGMFAKQHFKQPLDGEVEVKMSFYIKGRRGDCDNLQKSLLDGLNGVAWKDDRQVTWWSGRIIKDSNERTEVEIKPIDIHPKGSVLYGRR